MQKVMKSFLLMGIFFFNSTAWALDAASLSNSMGNVLEFAFAGAIGAGAFGILGAQKGVSLGRLYEPSLGIFAAPAGMMLGAMTGIVAGGFFGVAAVDAIRTVRQYIELMRKKLNPTQKEQEIKEQDEWREGDAKKWAARQKQSTEDISQEKQGS
jgi:hypothetical protein